MTAALLEQVALQQAKGDGKAGFLPALFTPRRFSENQNRQKSAVANCASARGVVKQKVKRRKASAGEWRETKRTITIWSNSFEFLECEVLVQRLLSAFCSNLLKECRGPCVLLVEAVSVESRKG